MADDFKLVRLVDKERRVGASLEQVSRHWQKDKECFLFISPHDDDAALGAGLMIQLAIAEGIPVHVAVVTNGAMGYCSMEQKDDIIAIRDKENTECYKLLGVPEENIYKLNFPDCSLAMFQGRRVPTDNDPKEAVVAGFTGLQNSFTELIRKVNPTQCFLPTYNDLHPDHKYTYQEFLISVFHAGGEIWPELGKPLSHVPYINEMAVYCDFPAMPHLKLSANDDAFRKKLDSILLFKSQLQIKALVDSVEENGAIEYFKNVYFDLYNPSRYHPYFEEDKGSILKTGHI